jgi:hypothetical protein
MKKIKHILGTNAHWTINKQLANTIGLHETILLQHLIDLQESFFEDGGFYQQDERLLNDLPFTIHHIKQSRAVLKQKELITVKAKGLPAKNHYTVNVDKVLELIGLKYVDENPASELPRTPLASHQNPGNTNNKDNTNNKETNKENNKKISIVYDRLISVYPKNRVNSKDPVMKLLTKMDDDTLKLVVNNLNRYLKVAGEYVKNLRNYIEHGAYTEEWLSAEETKLTKKNTNQDTNNFSNSDWD